MRSNCGIKRLSSPWLWLAVATTAVLVMLYLRSVWHVCVADELRYFYQFHLKPGESYFHFDNLRPVLTMQDVWQSQVNHYMCVNGRALVHSIEQIISGIAGVEWFYGVNMGVIVVTVWLMVRTSVTATARRVTPWTALAAVVVFLYLFPQPANLWLSVNLALNYLWPSCLTLAVLALVRRMVTGRRPGVWTGIAAAVVSLLCGWSNEAFALPLSGALALWAAFNLRRLPRAIWSVLVPLWLGALALLASPGNWRRAADAVGNTDSFWGLLGGCHILLILGLVTVVALCRKPSGVVAFVKDNPVVSAALVMALGFSVVAHTGVRSMTAVELFSSVLLLRSVQPMLAGIGGNICKEGRESGKGNEGGTPAGNNKVLRAVYAALLVCLVVHQVAVTAECRRQYEAVLKACSDYESSADGVVRYDYRKPGVLTAPFVYHQPPTTQGAAYTWSLLGVRLNGDRDTKPFVALTPEAYDSLDSLTVMRPGKRYGFENVAIWPFHAIRSDAAGCTTYLCRWSSDRPLKKYTVSYADGTEFVQGVEFFGHKGEDYAYIVPQRASEIVAVRAVD